MGRFIADFICFDARVIIEVDGGQHAESRADNIRDQWFARNGFHVLRFWNNDVLKNLEGVLISVLQTLHERMGRGEKGRPGD
jgi:very-short-patch-repair endonuclease